MGMISQLGANLAHWELDPENKKLVSQFKVFINAFQSELQTNVNR
jgi:hypothetical protein